MALFRMKPQYRKRGGKLSYYGTATALSKVLIQSAATSIGDYAVFGGGMSTNNAEVYDIIAYNTSLVRTTPSGLSVARRMLAAASTEDYVMFAGGYKSSNWLTSYRVVDMFNKFLSKITTTSDLSSGAYNLAAASVGNCIIFAGGRGDNGITSIAQAYRDLTRVSCTGLGTSSSELAATSVGNYALFGGGKNSSSSSQGYVSTVSAYDNSLVRTTPSGLVLARNELAATSVGNYALFGGGYAYLAYNTSGRTSRVDAYDTSLVRTIPSSLSVARNYLAATTIKDYALFGGGVGDDGISDVVDAYDTSLVRTIPTGLSVARTGLVAASVGDYALFAGGTVTGVGYSDIVDAYKVA